MTTMDTDRLGLVRAAIEADVARGLYHGAVIRAGRGGRVELEAAIGTHSGAGTRALAADSVFTIFSLTKAFTNVLVLRAVELGRLALTTKVVDVIPEFKGAPRDAATL